jgi:hypothetical protein
VEAQGRDEAKGKGQAVRDRERAVRDRERAARDRKTTARVLLERKGISKWISRLHLKITRK